MTTEEEVQRNLSLIEYYKEQLTSMDMQAQYIQAAIADYYKAKMTIENLKKQQKGAEILVPVGLGVFLSASAKDTSKILVDIGAGLVIEKNADDAMKKIDSRIESLQKNQEKLYTVAQQVQTDAQALANKTQQMMSESN